MARKAEKKAVNTSVATQTQFSLSDSFTSLLLGFVVVVAAIVLFFSFISGKKQVEKNEITLPPEKIAQELNKTTKEETRADLKSVYTVIAGDTLWSISEKYYNSGFDWQKIAEANNISDPTNLEKGTKLTIPGVDSNILATNTSVAEEKAAGSGAISGDSYTVIHGDDLWDIAVRAYGDGYKWVDIAKANNLKNPNLIHADNVLKLPR